MARLAQADIVVDQLKVGWYGGFAVEATSLGKPVLCHIKDDAAGDNPFGDELPIVGAARATSADDLRALLTDPIRRSAAGQSGRQFVERHHDPRRVERTVLDRLCGYLMLN